MLRDRLITAAVVIAIIVPIFLIGGIAGIGILVAAFGLVGLWEMARALPALKASPQKEITLLLGLGLVPVFCYLPQFAAMAAMALLPLAVILLHLFLYHRIANTIESACQMTLALTYVMVPLCHAILIRRFEEGIAWIFYVLLVVCLGDTGAYLAGKYYGRHRFSKTLSPSKTLEGFAGGLAGNLIGMAVVKLVVPEMPSWAVMLPLTLLLAVLGPLGDLCASMIKRRLGIKDFGGIMPGHGGVMDRADSLVLAFPTAFYFIVLATNSAIK